MSFENFNKSFVFKGLFVVFSFCFGLLNFVSADELGSDWLSFDFFNNILGFFTYIRSIIETLWFGLTTMLTSIFQLIVQVFNSGLF